MSERSTAWVFAHPSMYHLAKGIVDKCDDDIFVSDAAKIQRRSYERQMSVRSKKNIEFCDLVHWDKFADNFPNLFIKDVKLMAGRDVFFIASFHSPEVIFEQLSIIYSIPRYLARSFTVILPYFPTGTMERVDKEGQIATAKTLATLLSAIPLTARGPTQLITYDIHALQERFYFSESIIPRLESAIPLLRHAINQLETETKTKFIIAFPDDGAWKRFHSFFPESNLIICNKIRDGDKRIVQIKDGPNPSGQDIVIVDDLINSGGTLIECSKVLLKAGAASVSAYVTHAVFPKESWKKFIGDEKILKNFWITDSLPHAIEISKHNPFKLLSISNVLAETLSGFDLLQ